MWSTCNFFITYEQFYIYFSEKLFSWKWLSRSPLAFPSVLDVLSRYKEQISGINHRIRKERRKGPCLFDVEGRFCKQEFVFFPVCVSLVQLLKKETEREIQRPVTVAMLYVHFSWTYRAPLRVVVFFVPLFPLEWLFFIHFYVESFF